MGCYNMLINSALSVSGFSRIGAKRTLSLKASTQIDLIQTCPAFLCCETATEIRWENYH